LKEILKMKLIKEKFKSVRNEVSLDTLYSKIYNQISYHDRVQVLNNIYFLLWDFIYDKITNQKNNQILENIKNEINTRKF